ncbi:hypothetical protein VNO77_20143 [Canavalia gladiata]|uniref:Uncharacterized protein n=1 Tax=Canavalia gladiata TaxID=3824 RepID=A0AAN9LSX6_CANGL
MTLLETASLPSRELLECESKENHEFGLQGIFTFELSTSRTILIGWLMRKSCGNYTEQRVWQCILLAQFILKRNEAFRVASSHVDESATGINTLEGLIQSLPMAGGMVVSRIVTRSCRERA